MRKEQQQKQRITVGNAARRLGVSKGHIYKLLNAGKLRCINVSISGRIVPQSIRISLTSVEEFECDREIACDNFEL